MAQLDSFTIRRARKADILPVARLYCDWVSEATTLGLRASSEHDLRAQLHKWLLIASDETDVIGFVTGDVRALEAGEWVVFPDGGSYLHLEDLYVAPAYRGRGIGSALMKRLMTLVKVAGVRRVAVYSSSQPWSRIARFLRVVGPAGLVHADVRRNP